MEKCTKSDQKFIVGEAYLFRCRHTPTIIGIFDKYQEGKIILESATYTDNYRAFILSKKLPSGYEFWRKAYRAELRDYMYNLAVYEIVKHKHLM